MYEGIQNSRGDQITFEELARLEPGQFDSLRWDNLSFEDLQACDPFETHRQCATVSGARWVFSDVDFCLPVRQWALLRLKPIYIPTEVYHRMLLYHRVRQQYKGWGEHRHWAKRFRLGASLVTVFCADAFYDPERNVVGIVEPMFLKGTGILRKPEKVLQYSRRLSLCSWLIGGDFASRRFMVVPLILDWTQTDCVRRKGTGSPSDPVEVPGIPPASLLPLIMLNIRRRIGALRPERLPLCAGSDRWASSFDRFQRCRSFCPARGVCEQFRDLVDLDG